MKIHLVKEKRCPACGQTLETSAVVLIQIAVVIYVYSMLFVVLPTLMLFERQYLGVLAFYGLYTGVYCVVVSAVALINYLKKRLYTR